MKKIIKNQHSRIRDLLRYFSLAVVFFGIWFTANNIYKFSIGYFAVKTSVQSTKSDEIKQQGIDETETQLKTESKSIKLKEGRISSETEQELYPERPEIGDEIGELYIPKLDATLPIFHGSSADELKKGVGHFEDSVLPGECDNSVLSGHRDTIFRKLGEVGKGDLLIVRTIAGEFKYKVSKVRIVDEDDRTVIVPKPKATLTVSTCYPFGYIGPAPKRYVLVAYLDSKTIYE